MTAPRAARARAAPPRGCRPCPKSAISPAPSRPGAPRRRGWPQHCEIPAGAAKSRSGPDRPKPGGAVAAGCVADENGPLAGMLKARALAPPPPTPAAASVERRPYSMRDPVTIKCARRGPARADGAPSPLRRPASPTPPPTPGAALSRSCGPVLVPPSGRCASCASTACPRRCAWIPSCGRRQGSRPRRFLPGTGPPPLSPSPRPRPSKAGAQHCGIICASPSMPGRMRVPRPPVQRSLARFVSPPLPLPAPPFHHAGGELACRTAPTRRRWQCQYYPRLDDFRRAISEYLRTARSR